MFSRTVEYALRAVTYIAGRAPEACTTEEVSVATHVPRAYLSKVLQSLRRSGLLKSQRGLHGGMSLARDPRLITLLDVKNGVDAYARIVVCPLGLLTHASKICRLHRRVDAAMESVERELSLTTLADVLGTPGEDSALCEAEQSV